MNRPRLTMDRAGAAALATGAYAAMFGVPALPVAVFVAREGRLPSLWGLFDVYAGPWSARLTNERVIVLLVGYAGVTVVAGWSAWLLWKARQSGGVLNLVLLPVEAVFWIGFALPVPWLFGIARVVLVVRAWPELSASGRRRATAPTSGAGRPSA